MSSKEKAVKKLIPDAGMVLAKNEIVTLKVISPEEYDYYMEVSYDCSIMKFMFNDEVFKAILWKEYFNDYAITASIYDTSSGVFIGYCSIKDTCSSNWELSIEEITEYRNKGFGYNAISLFVNKLYELTGNRFYRIRVDIDNIASQKLWRRLGAHPNGISEFLFYEDSLDKIQKENINNIDDNIRALADEFCIAPEDLIGHVLEYRLDVNNIKE